MRGSGGGERRYVLKLHCSPDLVELISNVEAFQSLGHGRLSRAAQTTTFRERVWLCLCDPANAFVYYRRWCERHYTASPMSV